MRHPLIAWRVAIACDSCVSPGNDDVPIRQSSCLPEEKEYQQLVWK
ncbi:MAG TPA: hypothetical protein V6D30_10140 [Leptolyngbyaceae cyanobacterium]